MSERAVTMWLPSLAFSGFTLLTGKNGVAEPSAVFEWLVKSHQGKDGVFKPVPVFSARLEQGGSKYLFGEEGMADAKSLRGIVWVRMAAADGDPDAMNNLGVFCALGVIEPMDRAKAIALFQKAFRRGNAEAYSNLGVMYRVMKGAPEDAYKFFQWCEEKALKGDAEAQALVGTLLVKGHVPADPSIKTTGFYTLPKSVGTPEEILKAMEWYHKAALQGHCHAQYMLGTMLTKAKDVETQVQGKSWLLLACRGGHRDAVGALHEAGGVGSAEALIATQVAAEVALTNKGIAQESVNAAEWYTKAVVRGDASAPTKLAKIYARGIDVPKDEPLALAWCDVSRSLLADYGGWAISNSMEVRFLALDVETKHKLTSEESARRKKLSGELLRQMYK